MLFYPAIRRYNTLRTYCRALVLAAENPSTEAHSDGLWFDLMRYWFEEAHRVGNGR